ncbi:MAG: C39 family peptidase [Planctomycetota bacterium]
MARGRIFGARHASRRDWRAAAAAVCAGFLCCAGCFGPRTGAVDEPTAERTLGFASELPADADLPRSVAAAHAKTLVRYGIAGADAGCCVFDLTNGRLALLIGKRRVDGVDTPSIGVLLQHFASHPQAAAARAHLRANPLWKDWQLDTARVGFGAHDYLIAAWVKHTAHDAYLAEMGLVIDEFLAAASRPRRAPHELLLHDETVVLADCHESGVLEAHAPFNRVLMSWNIAVASSQGFCVELRVGRRADASWSPYLEIGNWGDVSSCARAPTEFAGGKVDVDVFHSSTHYDRVQYRIRVTGGGGADAPRLTRFAVCLSDLSDTVSAPAAPLPPQIDAARWQRRLPVPYRSQRAVGDTALASRICSPTSVAMLLEYRGVPLPTETIAAAIFDREHDIYGNWPRAIQAAYLRGVPGYLRAFSGWREVEQCIANDQPLVISVRARAGELRGAPYDSTAGHLLVLAGFDAAGHVLVNDPAATDAASGQLRYSRADLERVWFATGGVAYVLEPKR